MRIGQGFDVHRFGGERALKLGGVAIPDAPPVFAHSDGDCLLHALTDAVLGALALGDIGTHFPDDDPAFADADSRMLLREGHAMARAHGWRCENVDATVILQRPRLAPHIPVMREHIAGDLQLDAHAVSVKATTSEHLGFPGRGEGVAAIAVVLLTRR